MSEKFDYNSIRNRVLTNLSNKTEHNNVFANSALVNIIEAISEEMEDQQLQDEYLTIENTWSLAQNRSSLLTESKVHNYDVPRKRGATGNIRFGVSEAFDTQPSKIIDFPKWTQTSDNTGIDFTTVEANSMPITETYVDILSVQGIHKTYSNFAQGSENETFIVLNDSIEDSHYDLYINDILWTPVETLFDYGINDKVYEIKSLVDFSGIKITFGNGTNGKILSNGDTIKFDYIETKGSNGNIVASGLVTNIDSTIYNVNFEQVELFCTNTSSLAGGEDEAPIEEIRTNSPRFFQSGDRATTKQDYQTIIEGFSYIKKVSVTGAYEYNLDNGNDLWAYIPTQDNLVNIIALTTTDEGLTEDQAIQLTRDIREKNAPTDILTYPEITIIPMVFNMDVAVNTRSLTLNEVNTNIDTNLANAYNIDVLDFYDSVFNSDYSALIDNTAGVRKHNSYVTLLEKLDFSSAYALPITLPLFPITGTGIKVYVKLKTESVNNYELIGQGSPTGFIIGEVGYTFSAISRILLTTGKGSLAILEGLTEVYTDYDVRIEYRLVADDVELLARTQILKYDSSNYIDIKYYKGGN
ncbi:MAG: hypothetical protein PF569_06490 [Candidatus Woesearchaeota archaeon]|jgi:hypothetical protein|nr:hypothetical protein [Candidatus Woesearchaeota archaeon]